MKASIFVQIIGKIDSKALWEIVEPYGVNLTDMGETSLVYGECTLEQASEVIFYCTLFGDAMTEISLKAE